MTDWTPSTSPLSLPEPVMWSACRCVFITYLRRVMNIGAITLIKFPS